LRTLAAAGSSGGRQVAFPPDRLIVSAETNQRPLDPGGFVIRIAGEQR
jgi:hypothetical protein